MEKYEVYLDSELEALIPQYLENRENELQELKNLVKTESFEKIRVIGHSLKGSGGAYGFDYLTELGAELEKNAELKNKKELKSLLEKIEVYLNNLKIKYQEL